MGIARIRFESGYLDANGQERKQCTLDELAVRYDDDTAMRVFQLFKTPEPKPTTPEPSLVESDAWALVTGQTPITGVSSRQIAESTGKQHSNVIRDIERMLDSLGVDRIRFESVYLGGNGQERKQYVLDRRHAINLAAGYDHVLRMRIIDLCDALVTNWVQPATAPPAPKTFEQTMQEVMRASNAALIQLDTRVKEQQMALDIKQVVVNNQGTMLSSGLIQTARE